MLVSFGNPPDISPLIMNNTEIEMVTETKLLGVYIQSNLKWDAHIEYLNKKAASRLHFLRCLKRSGLSSSELVTIFITMIRSVLEYACPVWSTCLTKELSDDLESIQERACRIILPKVSYDSAREQLNLPLLSERRIDICKKLFVAMQNPDHRLHHLLPAPRSVGYGLRNAKKYPLPKCKTNRYKNSFVLYCLYNFQ